MPNPSIQAVAVAMSVVVTSITLERLDRAMRPYIEKARATYPAAKTRFVAGLPSRSEFFDAFGREEGNEVGRFLDQYRDAPSERR